jgi:hypothetical protein
MLFTSIRTSHFLALVTASLLCASAIVGAPEKNGLRVRTVQRNSGAPVELNPVMEERVLYLQGDRRRTEWRRESHNPLWPGGPRVTFYEPYTALIETCDGGVSKAFSLNLDNRTYAPLELRRKLTADEITSRQSQIPKAETPARPTALHEITTVDRGERKQTHGYTARHVVTTFRITPLEGSEVMLQETITEGWYIDLNTRISCDPPEETRSEGTTYATARLVLSTLPPGETTPSVSASATSLVKTTYIGKPETGFPISVSRTIRRTVLVEGRRTEQVTTSETEVVDLSWRNLDEDLFKVPNNFRSIARILPVPRAALWARWLAQAHYSWVRLRQSR